MPLRAVSLDDKYTLESGRVFLTGIQALVRLPMMQQQRDHEAGLKTAGFISGYRGSPLGGLDKALWQAEPFLQQHRIHFQPGLNEELAATAVWGSQQVGLFPGARYEGVFALWYGKGPGVDRCGDVLRHANAAGVARHGGVLALAGDDHAAKSSTFPNASEHAFIDAMIPVLHPAGVQEIIDYGLIGWAMSRACGCWIALKITAETVDSSASVLVDPHRVTIRLPAGIDDASDGEGQPFRPGSLNIRWPDPPLEQEERLIQAKLHAALAFARANHLDQVAIAAPRPRLGIVTTGKSYLDVRQALDELELDDAAAAALGLSLYKVAMPWPLEPQGLRAFAHGLDEILVVEEKRSVLERQIKEQLYHGDPAVRPQVAGKLDPQHRPLLPAYGELSAAQIAVVIGQRLLRLTAGESLARRVAFLEEHERQKRAAPRALRRPTFCSGCPHNTSTVVPEGSRAVAGIGCHYMATWLDRRTDTFTQMGGEGVPWLGQAPFTDTRHIFANLGDGTYLHSGSLAIRAALAAGVAITYKILYNDAVAMTGGQPLAGALSVPQLTRQLAAEGVARIALVSDQPERYAGGAGSAGGLAAGVSIHHRDALDRVQRELREYPGVSVLIYDQTCAAEKRRRRKRGILPDPAVRPFINSRVCEGCGDCSTQSHCVSILPLETAFGRKRQIDLSTCNKDFSCLKGFCPAFVTVEGGSLRTAVLPDNPDHPVHPDSTPGGDPAAGLPEPVPPALEHPWNLYVTGIGGTGIVTIGALLGMAAHSEGKGVSVLDMTGLAQKNGAVTSHVRIAAAPECLHAVRIAAGAAHLVLGGDLVVAAAGDALSKMAPGITRAVLNYPPAPTLDFTRNPDHVLPVAAMLADIRAACGDAPDSQTPPATAHPQPPAVWTVEASRLATALLGDALAANLFLLGYAWQKGLIPLSREALDAALVLNGAAVAMNRAAFAWGRRAAVEPGAVAAAAAKADAPPDRTAEPPPDDETRTLPETFAQALALRLRHLAAYQNPALAARFQETLAQVEAQEAKVMPGHHRLTEVVMRVWHRLLTPKDEYEVARLYTDGVFDAEIARQFTGKPRIVYHLVIPFFARRNPEAGRPEKRRFGPWLRPFLRGLAALRAIRGRWYDPFARQAERRWERQLAADYARTLERLCRDLSPANYETALALAALPERIRGFGHIKEQAAANLKAEEAILWQRFVTETPSSS